jgi:hypothetical protein
MNKLILAAAALALIASPGLTLAKAAPKYDCTNVTPAKVGGKPATSLTTTLTTAKGGTMKACATQWDSLSPTQKGVYNTQATTMKSKSGGKLSGYNVFTGECMKKK